MPLAVAKRYAQALGEVVTKPASGVEPEAVLGHLEGFHGLLEGHAELKGILLSPAVAPAKKHAIVKHLGERLGYPKALCNFLYVVIDHRRLNILDELIEAFRGWLDDHLGIARIEVLSALPVPQEQRAELVATFNQVTGRQVRAQFREDPAVLAGLVVKYGSRIYDGSLAAQLRALDRAIAQHA
jgi:F-type H+-transporting ATPase subunit delta